MNRAIGHFIVLLAAIGIAACTTTTAVRVYPDVRAAAPVSADSVVVAAGDTLYGIAARHGVALRELTEWNALKPPYTIHAGDRLRLKAPDGARAAASDSASLPGASASAPSKPATPTSTNSRPATGPAIAWRWPADGVVPARANAASGIDIAGKAGSAVRATADGVVLYSGAGSSGNEELIVLRHANGWVSSYAHNQRRRVAEGQTVKAGVVIAEMGRTGAARGNLHFELRHDGAPVDPLKYLPRR